MQFKNLRGYKMNILSKLFGNYSEKEIKRIKIKLIIANIEKKNKSIFNIFL